MQDAKTIEYTEIMPLNDFIAKLKSKYLSFGDLKESNDFCNL